MWTSHTQVDSQADKNLSLPQSWALGLQLLIQAKKPPSSEKKGNKSWRSKQHPSGLWGCRYQRYRKLSSIRRHHSPIKGTKLRTHLETGAPDLTLPGTYNVTLASVSLLVSRRGWNSLPPKSLLTLSFSDSAWRCREWCSPSCMHTLLTGKINSVLNAAVYKLLASLFQKY